MAPERLWIVGMLDHKKVWVMAMVTLASRMGMSDVTRLPQMQAL